MFEATIAYTLLMLITFAVIMIAFGGLIVLIMPPLSKRFGWKFCNNKPICQ